MIKHQSVRARLLATALVLGAVAAVLPLDISGGIATAQAQSRFSISFDTFHDELASYGDWVYSDRWGMVWLPDVGADFQPYYTEGRWESTREYGWTWVSDYDWGDIPFHYGRWVNDPYDGWMWIPGYMWSPGWVVWRSNPRYMGWMPLPPDDDFLSGSENVSFRFSFGGRAANYDDFDGFYGYSSWYGRDYNEDRFARNWVFIGADHLSDRDYRASAMRQPAQIVNIFHETHNVTNYTVVNNYIVNRSADADMPRAGGRRAAPRAAADVLRKPGMIGTVDNGRRVEQQAKQDGPRGRGTANSAPKPAPAVVQDLSQTAKRRGGTGGGGAGRLFTRDTIGNAPLPPTRAALGNAPAVDRQATEPTRQPRPDQDRANDRRGPQNDRARQADDNRTRDQAQERQVQEKQARDNQVRADQAKEQQAKEQQAKEQQAKEQQAKEQRAADDRRANDQRANQQRANDQRANDQRVNDQRVNDQRANDQRATQQRANDQRNNDQRNNDRANDQRRAEGERKGQQERAVREQPATQQPAALTNQPPARAEPPQAGPQPGARPNQPANEPDQKGNRRGNRGDGKKDKDKEDGN